MRDHDPASVLGGRALKYGRLAFCRPDAILHVYAMWRDGVAGREVWRAFGIRDSRNAAPFIMLGGRAIIDYVAAWRMADEVPLLRQLPSLARLPAAFWDHLTTLRVRGSVKALAEGTPITKPIVPSQQVLEDEGDGAYDFPLITITDSAAVVALVSHTILALLDAQVHYGTVIFNQRLSGQPQTFWPAERSGHPVVGKLSAEVEAVLATDDPTHLPSRVVWVAWPNRGTRPPQSLLVRVSRQLDSDVRTLHITPVNVELQKLGKTNG